MALLKHGSFPRLPIVLWSSRQHFEHRPRNIRSASSVPFLFQDFRRRRHHHDLECWCTVESVFASAAAVGHVQSCGSGVMCRSLFLVRRGLLAAPAIDTLLQRTEHGRTSLFSIYHCQVFSHSDDVANVAPGYGFEGAERSTTSQFLLFAFDHPRVLIIQVSKGFVVWLIDFGALVDMFGSPQRVPESGQNCQQSRFGTRTLGRFRFGRPLPASVVPHPWSRLQLLQKPESEPPEETMVQRRSCARLLLRSLSSLLSAAVLEQCLRCWVACFRVVMDA